MVFDSHVHLDNVQLSSFIKSQANAPDEKRIKVISNSTDYLSSKKNVQISRNHDGVIPFVGIHPEIFLKLRERANSSEMIDKEFEGVSLLCSGAVGIGEIGLDSKYSPIETQIPIFKRQLELAIEKRKPISIHSRGTVGEILEILSTHSPQRILFHWFGGSEIELARLMDRGFYVSYGPVILSSKSRKKLLEKSNSELTLAETDSPLNFGTFFRTSALTPFAISSVLFCMARTRRLSYDEMVLRNDENVMRFLGLPSGSS